MHEEKGGWIFTFSKGSGEKGPKEDGGGRKVVNEPLVVSNNPQIDKVDIYVEGGFLDVLIRCRDLVYLGHRLLVHPLFASIRMIYSPLRTLMLSPETFSHKENQDSEILIADAIEKYQRTMGQRKEDRIHFDDYAKVDKSLHEQAIRELGCSI